jgi:hypothetical protein
VQSGRVRRRVKESAVGVRHGGKGPESRLSACTEIVLLDQEPLKKKAAAECAKETARLERLRADWARFQEKDQPLFAQWLAHHFGALLSELREGEQMQLEKMSLIDEVELLVFMGEARTHRAAYKMVLERRAAPPEEPCDDERDSGDAQSGFSEGFPDWSGDEQDEELLFNEFLEVHLGLFAEDLSRSEYKRLFTKFKREVLGQPPPPKKVGKQSAAAKPAAAESASLTRLKDIYRQLVRRLHPDARTDAKEGVGAIWHEVQEAYAKGDLDRLERLFALSEVTESGLGAVTSLSQLGTALKELRRSIQAMLRSLSEAKKDPAWRFSEIPDNSVLRARIQRDLSQDRKEQRARLAQIDAMLASWEPKGRRPNGRRR